MKFFLIILIATFAQIITAKAQDFGEPKCDLILKAQFKKGKIKICNKTLDVEIADSDWHRAIGLMCREKMGKNEGMIFVFENERPLSFWMKNTKIPLSIGYFDKNKTLIDTYDMAPMNETKVYPSKKDSLYAIEVNEGWYKKNKVTPGCKFELVTKGQ